MFDITRRVPTCQWAINFSYNKPHKFPSLLASTINFRRNHVHALNCSSAAADFIIVGAGVAGSALAYTLAKDGRRVHVIERDLRQPDRIVGELLQPGVCLKLIVLGLKDCVEQIDAQRVLGYVLFKDGKYTKLPYPLEKFDADVTDPSPILFYPISSTEVRCLVDIPGQKVPPIGNGKMANYLKTMVAPQIPHELHDAFISAINRGNIRTMPNSSMPAVPYPTHGALLLGDAFNMRHPLTGGGMTVTLSDIVVLRDLLRPFCDLNDATSLCKYLESFYTLRKPMASTINTLAGSLYKVFSATPDLARRELRQACFDYLSLGTIFSTGPMGLLSGLNPSPLSLVLHFFAVAIYRVGRLLLLPFPSLNRIWVGARLILCASGIIFPIIKAEGVRQMFFPAILPAFYRTPPAT